MKQFCVIFAMLSIWMALLGCGGMQRGSASVMKDAQTVPSEKLQEVINRLENKPSAIHEANKEIIKKAEDTKEAAVSLQTNPLPDNVPEIAVQISKNSEAIKNAAVTSDEAANSIKADWEQLKQAQVQVIDLAKENAKLREDLDKERSESIKKLYSYLHYFFGIGFLVIVAGAIIGFLSNPRLGMMISGIGVLGLGLAAGAVYYLQTIALVGICIIVGSMLLALIMGLRSLFVLDRAVKENVKVIDAVKPELTLESKEKIFGSDLDTGIAGQIQSLSTKNVVKQLRGKKKK